MLVAQNYPLSEYICEKTGEVTLRYGCLPRGGIQYVRNGMPWLGLKNYGTTCYLNSVLQCLYAVYPLREAIFGMTQEEDECLEEGNASPSGQRVPGSPHGCTPLRFGENETVPSKRTGIGSPKAGGIRNMALTPSETNSSSMNYSDEELDAAYNHSRPPPEFVEVRSSRPGCASKTVVEAYTSDAHRALQRVFYRLGREDLCQSPTLIPRRKFVEVEWRGIVSEFGWTEMEQHDAQELNRLLCDSLETRMKGTLYEGLIKRLFAGQSEVYIECVDVEYKSSRVEEFYDVQLDVENMSSLEDSLTNYLTPEMLDGDNLYHPDNLPPQRAIKGVRFLSLPPILQFHLKRFNFDPKDFDMVKLNSHLAFPTQIDMTPYLKSSPTKEPTQAEGDGKKEGDIEKEGDGEEEEDVEEGGDGKEEGGDKKEKDGEERKDEEKGSNIYKLWAIVTHQGDVNSGHYYSFIRNPSSCQWVRYDDEYIWLVDDWTAVDSNFGGESQSQIFPLQHEIPTRTFSAYILFYVDTTKMNLLSGPSIPPTVSQGLLNRFAIQKNLQRDLSRRQRLLVHDQNHIT